VIETERLVLRPPMDDDRPAVAAINGDPEVGAWLASVLTREESDAMIDRVLAHIDEHGFGFWVAERKADRSVIGLIGLIAMGEDLPPGPAIEAAWRLSPAAWGQGYATEGARVVVDWALDDLHAPEVVAITARSNLRSQAVMRRIGMVAEPSRDFDHPRLAQDHPLRPHVTFSARR